ncbi:Hemin uptake protein hemP [Botrimarina colliarenosi]|uniref:Hemin uptake protein hemP n=1 Tax=Botrimarina colliarenosi TaxID=2528001 RepID=A0A5C6ACQ1_9BACT|nr:hemin uptake protein HemP [Botrimarina colliarenosi]TWT97734.1 Hemin uptake protein hemP [Botrimarina colliarenosi]
MSEKPTPVDPNARHEAILVRMGGCPTSAAITRTVSSADLFGSAKTVLIQHAGEQYRLIVTKNDKLLLQK